MGGFAASRDHRQQIAGEIKQRHKNCTLVL
jgi:hypothetical protein